MKAYIAEDSFGRIYKTIRNTTVRYLWLAHLRHTQIPYCTTTFGWCNDVKDSPKINSRIGINPFPKKKVWRVEQVSFYKTIKISLKKETNNDL